MKKCLALGVILLLIFVFAGCDQGPSTGPEEEYTLEISVTGPGTVGLEDKEIGDGETETFTYSADDIKTVTPKVTPDEGYKVDWQGEDAERITDDGEIAVDGDLSLEAVFVEDADKLEIMESVDCDEVRRTPAITEDTVIVPAGDTLLALEKDNLDNEIWSYEADAEILTSPLVDKDGNVYFGTEDDVIALDSDGGDKWDVQISNFTGSDSGFSLILASENEDEENQLIVGSNEAKLYGVDTETGDPTWKEETDVTLLNKPAVDGDEGKIVVAGENEVKAYDIDDQKEEWTQEFTNDNQANDSSPALGDGTVYTAVGDSLYALDIENGDKKWDYETDNRIISSPVLGEDETVYVGSTDGNFYAIDSGGEEDWSINPGARISSTAAVNDNGEVIFGDSEGTLYLVNSDGEQEETQELYGSIDGGVAIDDGAIYVGSLEGKDNRSFYSLHGGNFELADSPWPKMGADLGNTSRK